MSLVHQVLRDIDQRNGTSEVDIPAGLRFPEKQQKNLGLIITLVAVVIIVIALAIWQLLSFHAAEQAYLPVDVTQAPQTIQTHNALSPTQTVATQTSPIAPASRKPANSKPVNREPLVSQVEIPEQSQLLPMVEVIGAEDSRSVQANDAVNNVSEKPAVSQTAEIALGKTNTSEVKPNSSIKPALDKPVVDDVIVDDVVSEVAAASDMENNSSGHLKIERRNEQYQQRYMDSLVDMREKNWTQAAKKTEQLLQQLQQFHQPHQHQQARQQQQADLNEELYIKVLKNRLRIYLEERQFAEFQRFYQQHKHITDDDWLSTAAPGLHMVKAYDDAINSYRLLINQQPHVVNWPIALSLALEQNQQTDKAIKVLELLLNRYKLSQQQSNWIEQKIARLK